MASHDSLTSNSARRFIKALYPKQRFKGSSRDKELLIMFLEFLLGHFDCNNMSSHWLKNPFALSKSCQAIAVNTLIFSRVFGWLCGRMVKQIFSLADEPVFNLISLNWYA